MHTTAGERIIIRGQTVGAPDRHGLILEVRGDEGQPPYMVRFDDGHESLVYPGPDCVLEHAPRTG